jgi:ubiquitin conjugation factor E4 B
MIHFFLLLVCLLSVIDSYRESIDGSLETNQEEYWMNMIQIVLMKVVMDFSSCPDFNAAQALYSKLHSNKRPLESNNHTNHYSQIGQSLKFSEDILENKEIPLLFLRYLMECYDRALQEEKNLNYKNYPFSFSEFICEVKSQCVHFSILLLTNTFSGSLSYQINSTSILTPFILNRCWPTDFIFNLVSATFNEDGINGNFSLIFEPLLSSLWQEMQRNCSFTNEENYKLPLQALTELCDIKIDQKRPICHLVSHFISKLLYFKMNLIEPFSLIVLSLACKNGSLVTRSAN